jgi:hypothetical protein
LICKRSGTDTHFAATVGLGVTEIEAANAEEAVAAIRAGHTSVVGKRTPSRFFIGNTVQSIYTIVRKRVKRGRKVKVKEWANGYPLKGQIRTMTTLRYRILWNAVLTNNLIWLYL